MISAIVETILRQQRIRQVLLASTIFDPCLSRFDGSRRLISELALKLTHALPPGHLKLVRFPAHSPLPIAALPSMSRVPRAPLKLVCFPAHLPLPTAALPSMSLSPKAPLKLVCFPAHSPLPTAALPSMSLSPNAPLKLAPSPTRSLLPSQFYLLSRSAQTLH